MMPAHAPTEHQENWWGTQKCRRCNMLGVDPREGVLATQVLCPDCDGSGWTVWAALATEPWTEIVPNLWIGGHDYNVGYTGTQVLQEAYPNDTFDLVVSMYHRLGHEPASGVEHHEFIFTDGQLSDEILGQATQAGRIVADGIREGRKVLVRCQAGLNRSSLVAGIALVILGFSGADAVQLIRARRSPWALCNEQYAQFLFSSGSNIHLAQVAPSAEETQR